MATRTVFVKADGVARPHKIEGFEGSTYGEFKQYVQDEGFDLNFNGNVRVVLKSSQNDLVDDNASMPDIDNEVVFIMVDKSENGSDNNYANKTYNELKACARQFIIDRNDARWHFGQYHMLGRLALINLLTGYNYNTTQAAPNVATSPLTVPASDWESHRDEP